LHSQDDVGLADGKDLIYEGIATYRCIAGSFFPPLCKVDGKDLIYEGIATAAGDAHNL